MKVNPTIRTVTLIIILLILAGISLFAAYQAIVDWPGRQIIHTYMRARGISIQPGTPGYQALMRQIFLGEIPELSQISGFIKTRQDLAAVLRYAWKYSGYQRLYSKYRESDVPEANVPVDFPSAGQEHASLTPESTTTVGGIWRYQSTPLLEPPLYLTATAMPKPAALVYLIAYEPMIVRSAPDVNVDAIGQIPAEQAYPVLGRYIDWWLIDLGNNQAGWVYGLTHLTRFAGNSSLVSTIDLPSPRLMTPTPLCTPQKVQDIKQSLDDAQSTLIAFFDLLSKKEYARAADFFGSDYYVLRDNNPLVDPKDYATLFQHACEINGYQCLQVKQVVNAKVLSPYQYEFIVEFKQPDGSLFILGPCCGADETQQPPKSRWKYTVVLDCMGNYFVMDLPQYMP